MKNYPAQVAVNYNTKRIDSRSKLPETTPLTRNNFAQFVSNIILSKLRLIETFVTPMGKIDVLLVQACRTSYAYMKVS